MSVKLFIHLLSRLTVIRCLQSLSLNLHSELFLQLYALFTVSQKAVSTLTTYSACSTFSIADTFDSRSAVLFTAFFLQGISIAACYTILKVKVKSTYLL